MHFWPCTGVTKNNNTVSILLKFKLQQGYESVLVSQREQHQDPESEADKWNPAIEDENEPSSCWHCWILTHAKRSTVKN